VLLELRETLGHPVLLDRLEQLARLEVLEGLELLE